MSKTYDHREIEAKWQAYWEAHRPFRAVNDPSKPKFYCLDMFPYPSGDGLHVGHPEGYTATDIVCRFERMRGKSVLHPMGFDAFGLPAEQYAIDHGVQPAITTQRHCLNTVRHNAFHQRQPLRKALFPARRESCGLTHDPPLKLSIGGL